MTIQKKLQDACDAIALFSERMMIDSAIDSARINAEDSLAEGAITQDGYDNCFVESLVGFLSSRDAHPAVVAWFASHGVVA